MFKKLRNRFLLLNMIMISVLLICSFAVVFTMVYFNIDGDINVQLERPITNMMTGGMKHFGDTPPEPEQQKPPHQEEILLTLGKDRSIISVKSQYEYSDEFYQTIADDALLNIDRESERARHDHGAMRAAHTVKSDGSYWKYIISRDELYSDEADYYISVKNIDSEVSILEKLIIALACVLIFTLIIVFLICLYFANKSIKPIEAAWIKQNQFIADASHELKTPLTTINTNIDVLLSKGGSTIDAEKKWLMYIKDESTRMAKLTNDLLYLAKVDHSAESKTVFSEISLSNEVQSVLLTMEAVVFEKGLKLFDDIDENISIKGDPAQIKQLVMILLDNAVKYTKSGGEIYVKLTHTDKHAYLSVKNTGDGIPPEDAEKIFDRFYRSDKSRSRSGGGYGLGLAIAKSIVTTHSGSIKLNTSLGKYTEFVAKLPKV